MRGRPAALVGRIGASLLLLLFVGVAAVSGLDRMSLTTPALGRYVPAMFQTEAARSAARLAIVRQQPTAALAHAERAVANDPLDPASTGLLGTAFLLGGDAAKAEAAFRVAARFGWREPATQLYWYQAALQAGDLPRAVDRADAILRTRPDYAGIEAMLAPLESTPEGRKALIARMAGRPDWLSLYLRPDAGIGEETFDRRSRVLTELAGAGTSLGCERVAGFVRGAIERGARREAEAVWLGHCPGASLTGGLADGGFERFGGDSPFGWSAQPSGDVAIRTARKPGGNTVLMVRNQAAVSRLILRQPVTLEPGRYRLTGRVRPGGVAASLGCGQPPTMPAGVMGEIGGSGQILRVEPCTRLELGLWLRPGNEETELDALALEKID